MKPSPYPNYCRKLLLIRQLFYLIDIKHEVFSLLTVFKFRKTVSLVKDHRDV